MFIPTKEIFRWRRARRNKHEMSICTKLVVVGQIVFSTMSVAVAATTATDGAVVGGAANGTISQVDNTGTGGGIDTTVTQTGSRLTATWTTLGTAAKDNLHFVQKNFTDVAINKVLGSESSEFYGSLTADGRVFILNPHGVYFGAGSSVSVMALIATTAKDVTEGPNGVFTFSGSGAYGQVINRSDDFHVSPGGFAVLAAPYVENTGTIIADVGKIQLASANDFAVTVDLSSTGLINFTVNKEDLGAIESEGVKLGVDNSGTLRSLSGAIGISANLAAGIVQGVVNLNGVVDATALNDHPARVNGGTVLVESVGEINTGKTRSGNQEEPIAGAQIHADGAEGGSGGQIEINANGTNHVYSGTLTANGGNNGGGGTIKIISPDTTYVDSGTILTATGGANGGNGGRIEVSAQTVYYRGDADASAPNGNAGTLHIDPIDITIANGDGMGGAATIYEQNIERTSQNGTNVELVANNSITMQDLTKPGDGVGILEGGSGNISMKIDGQCTACSITFDNKNNQITTTATTSPHAGAITMTAQPVADPGHLGGQGTIDIGSLHTTGEGGSIWLKAGSGGITTRDLSTGGAGLGISHPGDINLTTINGGDIATGNISIIAEGGSEGASAYLDINSAGKLNTGSIFVQAVADSSGRGAIADAIAFLNAAGDITITGDITVEAKANLTYYDSASARAFIFVNSFGSGHDLSITGNTLVHATATQTGSYGWDDARAYASALLNAAHDITINGDITVKAEAVNEVPYAEVAYADAYLDVFAGNDLHITGDKILVQADASRKAEYGNASPYSYNNASPDGTNDVYANASANLRAGHDAIVVADSITVAGTATNNQGDANANACLAAAAGGGGGGCGVKSRLANSIDGYVPTGNLVLTGNTSVTAQATSTAGGSDSKNSDSTYASAAESLYAPEDVTVTGTSTVQANASNPHGFGHATALAVLSAVAGRDLNVTGNTLVTADALLGTEGNFNFYRGRADAGALTLLIGGRDVTTVGISNTVRANAENKNDGDSYPNDGPSRLSIDGGEGAAAGAAVVALAGVSGEYLGGVQQLANDIADGSYRIGTVAQGIQEQLSAGAGLNGPLPDLPSASPSPFFGSGNLHMTGDVTVTATATSVQPDAIAGALALFGAANDVTVLTDPITVTATATETGEAYIRPAPEPEPVPTPMPAALAAAGIGAFAGLAEDEGGSHGNVYITGDILADAKASGIYRSDAYAIVALHAPDNVTNLYATTPPTASASPAFVQAPAYWAADFFAEDTQATSNGSSYAMVSIDGGGLVLIEPKEVPPTGCPNDVCDVLASFSPRDPIGPLFPGNDPLRIGANGEVLWATAVALTAPPQPMLVTPDIATAIASGADPTTLLPATAAGAASLSEGLDAFSIGGGADFCDQVVSGSCLPKK